MVCRTLAEAYGLANPGVTIFEKTINHLSQYSPIQTHFSKTPYYA